ncbi:MAG: GNAT family N-acetyltransferase, partial [Waterburya sp.]
WKTTYTGILPEDYIQKLSYQKREHHWKNMLDLSTEKETEYFIYVAENTAQEIVGFIDGGLARSENSSYQG